MNKIVSLIASYNPLNPYVPLVVKELRRKSKVILFSTEKPEFDVDELFLYDKSIGKNLVYQPRKWIIDNIHLDWDYIIYNEDDILITETVLNNAIKLYEIMPDGFAPGFARYEYLTENNKRYIDLHPSNSIHRGGYNIIRKSYRDLNMFEPWNLHSGNFLFSKKDVLNIIANNKFETYFLEFDLRYGNCDQLESAASTLYYTIIKLLPKDVSLVQVHHLPNKYINMSHNYGDISGPGELEIFNEYESK